MPQGKRVCFGVFVPLIEALTERRWGDNSPPRDGRGEACGTLRHARHGYRAGPSSASWRSAPSASISRRNPAAGWSMPIEEGDEILAEALVRSHVDALKRKMPHPDAAVLGCTHYPLLEEVFQDALGPQVKVFSQADLVAASLADYLVRHPARGRPGRGARVPDDRRSAPQFSDQATAFSAGRSRSRPPDLRRAPEPPNPVLLIAGRAHAPHHRHLRRFGLHRRRTRPPRRDTSGAANRGAFGQFEGRQGDGRGLSRTCATSSCHRW